MSKLLKSTLGKQPIIGMIHFPPLIGYEGYPGFERIKAKTLEEVKRLNASGVHAILLENNYNLPHHEFVEPETTAMMTVLADLVIKHTRLPVGVCVLWNDYKTAFGIAAATGVSFVRIPAFVDSVITKFGRMNAVAPAALSYRKRLGLEKKVAIFADIQVKHSKMVDRKKPLSRSARQAVQQGADAIIVTGTWTGIPPSLADLEVASKAGVPVIVGSGSTPENLGELLQYADAIIVGTSVMTNRMVVSKKLRTYMNAYRKIKTK